MNDKKNEPNKFWLKKTRDLSKRYASLREHNFRNVRYIAKARLIDKKTSVPVLLLFIDRGILQVEETEPDYSERQGPKMIPYNIISDSKIFDHDERILLHLILQKNKKKMIYKLKNKIIAQEIIMAIHTNKTIPPPKSKNKGSNISIIVRVKDKKFFIICEKSTDFGTFVKKVLCKINRNIFKDNPVYEEDIDLKDFQRLLFSVVHQDGSEIPIENDVDFKTAIIHFDGKLDVNLKLGAEMRENRMRYNY